MTCAGVAGGIAGLVGNPTEVYISVMKNVYSILVRTKTLPRKLGCFSQDVHRWRESARAEVSVRKCIEWPAPDCER